MSEQDWREFLQADGVEDWVVLHGGPATFFRTKTMGEAAALAQAVTEVPCFAGSGSLLTIGDIGLTVRLARDLWAIGPHHIDLARAISAVARESGATADRSAVQEVQVAVAAKAETIDLPFWRAVLGYSPMADDNAVDPLGHGSTVWMQPIDGGKALRHAMHIDVSVPREHIEARLAKALDAGGTIVDDSGAPGSWILSDRAGNRVCLAAWPDGAVTPSGR